MLMMYPDRCNATIWKRDCLRRTGRGPTGFEMHYNKCRCGRKATSGDLCGQHAAMEERGHHLLRYETERSYG